VTLAGRAVAVLTSACLALLVFGSSAQGASGLTTGFADGVLGSPDQATRDLWLQRASDARAGLIRINVSWRAMVGPQPPGQAANPADPAYDFSGVDTAVQGAAAHGFDVMLTVLRAPDWAEGPNRPDTVAPGTWKPDPGALADFGRALATRYSGSFVPPGLSSPLPRVRNFQPWNEPNLSVYLTPQWNDNTAASPQTYRGMLNAFYAAVHAVQPDATVVTAGTAPYGDPRGGQRMRPLVFYRELLCERERHGHLKQKSCPDPAEADVVAHHPINTSGGPHRSAINPDDASTPDLKNVRKLVSFAVRKKTILPPGPHPLWVTEFWWSSDPPNTAIGIPEPRHARWIEEALYLFWKQGASVAVMLQIQDSPFDPAAPTSTLQSGLFFADGSPKQAFTAYRFPFVTHRSGKRLAAWGKAPASGTLVIERQTGDGWHEVKSLQVQENQVFQTKLPRRKATLRARVGDDTSLPWA
jgi:hypothetical protein